MKILMITPDFPPDNYGGIGIHVYNLTNELIKRGHNVDVIVIRCDNCACTDYKIEVINELLRVIRFYDDKNDVTIYDNKSKLKYSMEFMIQYSNIMSALKLKSFIECEKYDIMHIHDYYVAILYNEIRKINKTPSVVTIHSSATQKRHICDSLRRFIRIRCNTVIAVSEHIKDQTMLKYGNDQNFPKIYVVHNSVLCDKKLEDIDVVKKNEITFCGRLANTKGCDTLLRAFAKVVEHKSCILNIIGDGPERKKLEKLSVELGISNLVRFKGFLDFESIKHFYRTSKMVVVPSRVEPFATVALEAMAEGTCIICSNVDGFCEMIENNINGLLFKCDDFDELSEHILSVLNDENRMRNLSKNGFITVRDKFSWNTNACKIEKLYKETIKIFNESNCH